MAEAKRRQSSAKTTKSRKKPRVRELEQHRTLKLTKRKIKQAQQLSGISALFRSTVQILSENKRLFLGIAVVYSLASFVFIQGFGSSFNLVSIQNEIKSYAQDNQFVATAALFGYLIGSASSSAGESSSTYQLFLTIFCSLAVIWAVRQVMAGEKPTVKDAFYKGMYPLFPYMFVGLVVVLQFVPLLIGNLIYSVVTQNGLALSAIESILWLLMFVLLALLSLYMVVSSVFALYIVTLPNMTPIKALRSARQLVLHRRLKVLARIIALPLALLVLLAAIFVPLIMFVTIIAQPLFLLASSLCLVIYHVYMYCLYRDLL